MPRYFDVGGVGVVSFPNEADDDFVRKTLTTEYPDATKVNEVSFGEEPQVKPENNGVVLGSLLRGVDNLQASLYAGGAVASQAFGAEDAKNWFLSGYVRNLKEAEANPARIPSYKNIIDEHGDLLNTISNAGTYAIEGVLENVPTMVPALVGGGGASLLASAGRKALAGAAGAYAGNVAQEVGSIAGDIYQKTGKVEVGIPLAYGAVAAAVDTASDLIGASKFMQGAEKAAIAKVLGKGLSEEVTGRLIKRVGYEGLKQMGVEGVTEGVQTAIEKLALSHADPSTPFWTSENLDEIVDSVLKGGLSGGAFGAGGELYKSARGRVVVEAGTTVADVPPIIEADLTAADLERKAVALDQVGASETAKAVRETLDATPTIAPPSVEDLTAQFKDLHDGGIAVVQDPSGQWDARSFFDPETKDLLGIALNQSQIVTPEQAQIAVDHEISHAASESGILDETLKQLTGEEWDGIERDLDELGYSPDDDRETVARSVDVLRESWSNRNWFQQAVGHIMRYANKAGFRLTRLAAESIAAKAAADAYVRLKQISPAPTGEAAPSSLPAEPPMVVGGMVPTTVTQNAPEEVSVQKGVLGERANGNETRQAAEAGGGDSLRGAAQSQEKVTPYETQQAQQTRGEAGVQQERAVGDQGLRQEGGRPGLSPEEIVRDSRVRFKRSIEALTALAKDSEAFKNWYSEFKVFLEGFLESHPEYAPLLSEMLNATSAATAVESNVPIAVRAFKEFIQTGRFDSFTLLSHKRNLERAGRGEQLSGPKISQYSNAIFGDENAVPVDRHIAQLLFGSDSPTTKQIQAAKRRIAQIGMRLGWTPRQVQAALWAANQKRKGQVAVSYEAYLNNHRQAIFDAIASDTSGRGREASRRIAERIGAGRGAQGSVAGQPSVRESRVVTPQQDAEYMAAVEKGDTATAQRMVDDAAKAAGYTVGPVWRGESSGSTPNVYGRRERNEPGIFTTDNKQVADGYDRRGSSRRFYLTGPVLDLRSDGDGGIRTSVGRKFVRDWAKDAEWDFVDRVSGDEVSAEEAVAGGQLFDWEGDWSARRWKDLQSTAFEDGYNTVILPDSDSRSDSGTMDSYVAKDSASLKSAEPITRDDAGNVIPLSQRFQPTSPDIRYSKTPEPTYTGTGKTKPTEALKAIRKVVDDLPHPFDYHTQSEAQRTDAAKSFVKAFAGDMSRALLVANDPETYAKSTMSMQPIILGEIAKEAKAAGDTVAYDGVWDSLQRIGSSTGQNLQAFAQLRAMFDPSYLTARAGQSWKQGLGKQIGPVDGVKNVVDQGTKRARVTAKKAASDVNDLVSKVDTELEKDETVKKVIRKRNAKQDVQTTSDIIEGANKAFDDASEQDDIKKGLSKAEKSANRLMDQYAKVQKDTPELQPKPPVIDEVRKRFLEQVVKPSDSTSFVNDLVNLGVPEDTAAKLFSIAGTETKARGVVAWMKERAKFIADTAKGMDALLRATIKGVKWADVFAQHVDDQNATLQGLVDKLTADPRFALLSAEEQAALTGHLSDVWEKHRTRILEGEAARIQAPFVKAQKDTPDFSKPVPAEISKMRKIFLDQIANPKSLEEFSKLITDLGVSEATATRLFNIAATETKSKAAVLRDKLMRTLVEATVKGVKWAKIFDQHMEAQNATRQDLFNRLQADPEFQKLSQPDQLKLVNDLGKLWEEHRFKEIDGLLKKYAQSGGRDINKKMAQASRTVLPDLLRAANRGALFDETVWNAMAPKYGLPAWTPERAAKLQGMLEKEQKLPLNSTQRSRLAQERAHWMLQQKGVTNMEILGEWWYASVLSGIRTQVDNGASFVNAAIEAALTVAANPRASSYLVPAFFRGLAVGKRRFGDIALRGDFSHSITKEVDVEVGKLLAIKDDPSIVKRFLSNGRYVMQFMAATDTLNAAAAQELRATLLAYSRAKDIAAPSTAEFKKAFQDILQVSEGAIAAAEAQAQQEIDRGELKQSDLEKRRDEILEQQRPSDLTDAAREYGKVATGNREPTGLVGALYRGLKTTRMAAPIVHPALPFLRMAANLTNIYVDYLPPVALARLWFNHPESHVGFKIGQKFDKQFEKMSAEDYQLLKAKFVLGSAVIMQGLAYVMAAGDDDKDRWFDMEGSWSGLNTDQKIMLQNAKRQPYSFKVGDRYFSYKMLPYAAALATIGNVRDMQKYTKASKKEQLNYVTTAMFRGAMMVKDLSLLSGISDLMATANDDKNPDRFYNTMAKFTARTVGGLYPGIFKEAGAWVDPTMMKPLSFGELMLKEWPGSSMTIGRPALNVLGDPVEFPKYPWSRVMPDRPDSREMQALADKADMGVFPVIPDARAMLTLPGGKRRPMTAEEGYLYGKLVGEGYKKLLTDNISRFESMDAKQADRFLSGPAFDGVRARSKREIVRRSGGR